MHHKIITKQYDVRGKKVAIIQHEGKPWIKWASLKDLARFPQAASMRAIESKIPGGLGKGLVKTKVPASVGYGLPGWILSMEAVATVLAGFDGTEKGMIDEISHCFDMFEIDKDLPGSGEDEATSSNPSPQAHDEVEPSPEQEGSWQEAVKKLSAKFDDSMDNLVKNMAAHFEARLQELEMVKYHDQLGDMAERISNMEEKLYEYEAEIRDFKLLIRSLKEATGSQVQAETIAKLVGMIDK